MMRGIDCRWGRLPFPNRHFETRISGGSIHRTSSSLRVKRWRRPALTLAAGWCLCAAVDGGIARTVHDFAQIGDGAGLRTVFLVQNPNADDVTITIDLMGDEGTPLALEIDGSRQSRLQRVVPAGGALRLTTTGAGSAGSGGLQVGWARLQAAQQVAAQVFFEIRSNGAIVTQAAVESTPPLSRATAFLQLQSGTQTGVAVASLSESGSVRVRVTAFSTSGDEIGSGELILPPRGHQSKFIPGLIPDVGELEIGSIRIEASGPLAVTILQQSGLVIGSLPVIF